MCLCKAEYNIKTYQKQKHETYEKLDNQSNYEILFYQSKTVKLWKKDSYNNRKTEEYMNFTNILKNIINKSKDFYVGRKIVKGIITLTI